MVSSASLETEQASFDVLLGRELACSERFRLTVITILSVLLTIYALVRVVLFPGFLEGLAREGSTAATRYLIPGSLALLSVYALGVRVLLGRRVRAGHGMSLAYSFGTVTFEAAFPTIMIFVFGYVFDPIFVLISPVVLLYAVFMISSTLQMRPFMPIYSGILASAGYAGAYRYFQAGANANDYPVWLTSPGAYVGRIMLLLVIGLGAAFVAWQIRRRVLNLVITSEEKNRVMRTFGQHVSPKVVNRLLEQRSQASGEMRSVCILFLDIRGFTTFSETRPPEEVVETLNELFTFMIEVINRNDGFINKFLGDGFLAVFGAPLSSGEDCVNAARASREILEKMDAHNEARQRSMKVGIGIHAGKALTGEVGSEERKEYTVIGDVVNVAARIEQLNKTYDSQILLSGDVRDRLPEELRDLTDLGPVQVKGRKEEIRIYRMA